MDGQHLTINNKQPQRKCDSKSKHQHSEELCLTPSVSVSRFGLRLVPRLWGSDSEGCCSGTKCNVLLRHKLRCAHHQHKLSTRSATHRRYPALKTVRGMGTELVIQRGRNSATTLWTPRDPSRARGHPLPPGPVLRASFHRPAPAALLPPPSQGAALGSPEIRAGTAGRRRGWGTRGRTAPPTAAPHHAATPANARLMLRADPQPPHLGAAGSAAHRHITGPQRPVARAAEQAGAPSRTGPRPSPPLPSPRPAPRLPTPGFRRRSSSQQHHLVPTPPTHSREKLRHLSREELCDQARAKVGGLLKNERSRKNLPTCSGAASGSAPRVT